MPKKQSQMTRAEWLVSRERHVIITPNLREVLDGVLLSDGAIHHKDGRRTASLRLTQSPKRQGWLQMLRMELSTGGIITATDPVHVKPTAIYGRITPGGKYLLLRSLNYVELVTERQRWYPNGKKIVPRDLRLSPAVLLHWFCGDGRGGDRKGTLGFCTDGFTVEDVDFLVGRLRIDLGIIALRTVSIAGILRYWSVDVMRR